MKFFFFLILFSAFTLFVNAQRVRVTGTLMEQDTDIVKSDALINVVGSSEEFFTDVAGKFVLYINKKDSVKLFVQGYKTLKLYLGDSALRKEYFVKLKLAPIASVMGKAVLIRGAKNIKQIEVDISHLGEVPHELETPDIGMTSLISLLYDQFSKQGRNREKLKEQMFENNRRLVLNELYRFYNYNDIIKLPERYFEDFTNFHHLPVEFFQNNTYYDISVTIKAYYKKYAAAKGLW